MATRPFRPLLPGGAQLLTGSGGATSQSEQANLDGLLNKTVTKTAGFDGLLTGATVKHADLDAALSRTDNTITFSLDGIVGINELATLSLTADFDGELTAATVTSTVISLDGHLFHWETEEDSSAGLWAAAAAGQDIPWAVRGGVVEGFHDGRGLPTEGSSSPGGSGGTGGTGGSGTGGSEPPTGGEDEEEEPPPDDGDDGDEEGEEEPPPPPPPPGPDAFVRVFKTFGFDCILFARDRVTFDLSAVLAEPANKTMAVDALLQPSPAFSSAFSSALDGTF